MGDSIRAGSLAADFRDLSAATATLLENLYDILARSGITWTVRAGAALPDGRRLYDHVVDEIQYGRGLAQGDLADDVTEMIRLIAGTLNNLMQNRGGPIHGLMGSLAGRGSKIARSVFDMYAAAAGANVLYTANPETEDVVDRFNFFAPDREAPFLLTSAVPHWGGCPSCTRCRAYDAVVLDPPLIGWPPCRFSPQT